MVLVGRTKKLNFRVKEKKRLFVNSWRNSEGASLICISDILNGLQGRSSHNWWLAHLLTEAYSTLLLAQSHFVALDESVISEIKSHEAVFETLSSWISAWMWRATEPSHVLCPLLLIFIFADRPLPKNPFIAPSPGHICVACHSQVCSPQSRAFSLPNALAQLVRCHESIQSALAFQCDDGRVGGVESWDKGK